MGHLENSNLEMTMWRCSWLMAKAEGLRNLGPELETGLRAQSLQTPAKVPWHCGQSKPAERLAQLGKTSGLQVLLRMAVK